MPDAAIQLGGGGSVRTLTLALSSRSGGRTEVTIAVSDGQDTSDVSFNATIGGPGTDNLGGTRSSDFVLGRQGNDTLSGGEGDDLLSGGRGDDALRGDAGNDHLVGDRGHDRLTGGTGADLLNGGPGADTMVDLSPAEGDEQVDRTHEFGQQARVVARRVLVV